MDNYIVKFFLILLAVLIGATAFAGDTNSVKSSMYSMLTKVTTKIDSVQ